MTNRERLLILRATKELAPFTSAQLEELLPFVDEQRVPGLSGGLLASMYLYQRLLTLGLDGFQAECTYGGYEPFYPPPADGKPAKKLADLRVDCEVINTRHGTYMTKWFFSRAEAMPVDTVAFSFLPRLLSQVSTSCSPGNDSASAVVSPACV